jgi:hypothetical protein
MKAAGDRSDQSGYGIARPISLPVAPARAETMSDGALEIDPTPATGAHYPHFPGSQGDHSCWRKYAEPPFGSASWTHLVLVAIWCQIASRVPAICHPTGFYLLYFPQPVDTVEVRSSSLLVPTIFSGIYRSIRALARLQKAPFMFWILCVSAWSHRQPPSGLRPASTAGIAAPCSTSWRSICTIRSGALRFSIARACE